MGWLCVHENATTATERYNKGEEKTESVFPLKNSMKLTYHFVLCGMWGPGFDLTPGEGGGASFLIVIVPKISFNKLDFSTISWWFQNKNVLHDIVKCGEFYFKKWREIENAFHSATIE